MGPSSRRPSAIWLWRDWLPAGLPIPEVLVAAEDVARGKPDPECYLLGASRMGVPASECLVFEDAPFGLAAGHAAGAQVVALTTSLTEAELAGEDSVPDYRGVRVEVGDAGLRLRIAD